MCIIHTCGGQEEKREEQPWEGKRLQTGRVWILDQQERQEENTSWMFDSSAGDINLADRGSSSSCQKLHRSLWLDLLPRLSFRVGWGTNEGEGGGDLEADAVIEVIGVYTWRVQVRMEGSEPTWETSKSLNVWGLPSFRRMEQGRETCQK